MMSIKKLIVSPLFPEIDDLDGKISSVPRMMEMLNVKYGSSGLDISSLPFSCEDATAGSEAEIQAVVAGGKTDVDLPVTIEQSNYFANIIRRAMAGDTRKRVITDLEKYLNDNAQQIWENSWVRIDCSMLSSFTETIFQRDILTDKEDPAKGVRSDVSKFLIRLDGHDVIRVPVSYFLKLSLAEVIGTSSPRLPRSILQAGLELMGHYLNDNTSPETYSFHIIPLHPRNGMGRAVAKEMAKRYLLTQLLTMYGNERFRLIKGGQQAQVFYSPHPPVRQKMLNNSISDAFYREIFMNPCLAGWQRGEAKYHYMHLCHLVLSRSQLNAVAKLREAGIITNNLVTLPNTSNISLANNGTHVSLGSRRLGEALRDKASGFTKVHEKYIGDLVIKVVEHFLPLFVGTYTAAPYRLGFGDFHPEKALGFLPHELDYTHLRMLWRRWQKKAELKFFGLPITPFGPPWLDKTISALCDLRGDFVPDFRLIDYLVALMSTEKSPALDGHLHNSDRLKKDLADMGVFDAQMSLYLFEKLREYESMGFSGFEARHYSLFENFEGDMGRAVELQNLLYCLAFKYIASGRISHFHIPDNPAVESERRQIIFGAAIGIPTFFVRQDTDNLLMKRIIAGTDRVRQSHRYPGYLRVYNSEYKKALIRIIEADAGDLMDMLNTRGCISDLELRLGEPECSAMGRLTRGILKDANALSPLNMKADTFNMAAESYYRQHLRKHHMEEAILHLEDDLIDLNTNVRRDDQATRQALRFVLGDQQAVEFLTNIRKDILTGQSSEEQLKKLIQLLLITIREDKESCLDGMAAFDLETDHVASVC